MTMYFCVLTRLDLFSTRLKLDVVASGVEHGKPPIAAPHPLGYPFALTLIFSSQGEEMTRLRRPGLTLAAAKHTIWDMSARQVRLLSWNVNGIRALAARGFLDWLKRESPDVLCLQETKATPEQLDDRVREPEGYHAYWNYPQRKGYGGVATFSRQKPVSVRMGFGIPEFDIEGRLILSEHPFFKLFNVYFPNGKKDEIRLKYKLDFYDSFFDFIEPLRQKGERLIICGDFNTAHKEIDIARPKQNEKFSGFLPIERAWMDRLAAAGYIDTFRHFNKEPNHYTWWDMKTGARERNVGWRIDYFFVSPNLIDFITKAGILTEVTGSDHCPVEIVVAVPE